MTTNKRLPANLKEIKDYIELEATKYPAEKINKLHGNLALPSYVHGYSLAIQYMHDWFESKFEKDFFKGGIYVDGKHVLDDYKNMFSKNIIKGMNPRARMEPTVQFDYDRENLDSYMAPPNLYLRKSKYNQSFFKDYDRDMFLGIVMRALRMDFNFKVRVSTRSEQLDVFNRMEMYFRVGSTMHENVSVDYHVPKAIMINIADRAGFEIRGNEIVDAISFINYLNSHSDLPFLFKMRAINQQPEYFIRLTGLYAHINNIDKLQLDNGERDGKLDFNFHVEMNCTLTIPIPHYYSFYSASDITYKIDLKEMNLNTVALYSINPLEIPKVDENGWAQAAVTSYMTDKGDTEMDLSSIFVGDNILSKTIHHDLVKGLSPAHFINIKVYYNDDRARECPITMDWDKSIAYFTGPMDEEILHIAVYYDREYINTLNIEQEEYWKTRIDKA